MGVPCKISEFRITLEILLFIIVRSSSKGKFETPDKSNVASAAVKLASIKYAGGHAPPAADIFIKPDKVIEKGGSP